MLSDDVVECRACAPNAECLFDQSAQQYRCVCQTGYQGNGTYCTGITALSCRDSNICDANAQCAQDRDGNYRCYCRPGYRGEIKTCLKLLRN